MKRFWDKVDKSGDCWEWTGGKTQSGYGLFWYRKKTIGAHRFVMRQFDDRDDNGKRIVVMHHCDNPSCVNPDHLEIADQAKNMRDSWKKGRKTTPKRFCPKEIRMYHSQGCIPYDIAAFMRCNVQTVYNAINSVNLNLKGEQL